MFQKFKSFKLLFQFWKGYRRFFVVALFCVGITTLVNALTPQVIRITVDNILGNTPSTNPIFEYLPLDYLAANLIIVGLAIVFLNLIGGILDYFFRSSIAKASQGIVEDMRNRLFSHIQRLPYCWHSSHQTGDIIQRVTGDMEVVKSFIATHLVETIRILLLLIVIITLMFSMNLLLSLVAIIFIPLIIGYTTFFYGKIRNEFQKTDEAEGELVSVVQENLTGVRVVRAFGREDYEMNKFDDKNNAFSDLWIGLGYIMGAYWGLGDLFTGFQTLAVLIAGTVLTVNNQMTLGDLLAFTSYTAMITWPIRSLGRIFSEITKSGVSFDRLAYILDAEAEDENLSGVTPSIQGTISYENVSYRYAGATEDTLKNISFTIESGKTLGILGGTGSGKSTLVHLLNRLYDPSEGKVCIDGVDIKDFNLVHLRQHVGLVLQEPFLFSKTIRENIAIIGHLSEDEIYQSANVAAIHSSIESFKDGYETIVGERGVTLSGGQKQRVAIARMLSQKTPIIVFDDSLSALDTETDFAIRNSLKQNHSHVTNIIISHRINSIMHADSIIVLKDGCIKEQGTHSKLLSENGIYRKIYDIQFNSDDRLIEEELEHGSN